MSTQSERATLVRNPNKLKKESLEIKKVGILRNINLFATDIKDGFLTENFYRREDISKHKKEILKQLEEKLKKHKK